METDQVEPPVEARRTFVFRRLMQNLREQKWIAIAIDLLIVVVGVFLGMQAQQWFEDGKQAAQQQRYMERLVSDFDALRLRQESHFEMLNGIVDGATYVLDIVRMPEAEFRQIEVDDARFRRALRFLLGSRVPPGRSATYIEMLSSSQLSFVRNSELRDKLAEYDRASDTSLEVFRWITAHTQSAQSILLRHFQNRVVSDTSLPLGYRLETETYDLAGMRADPEFAIAVNLLLNGAANIRGVRATENRLTTEILALLAAG